MKVLKCQNININIMGDILNCELNMIERIGVMIQLSIILAKASIFGPLQKIANIFAKSSSIFLTHPKGVVVLTWFMLIVWPTLSRGLTLWTWRVYFIGEFLSNFDPKNTILIYTKDFSCQKSV